MITNEKTFAELKSAKDFSELGQFSDARSLHMKI